jgi:hypothetical protein
VSSVIVPDYERGAEKRSGRGSVRTLNSVQSNTFEYTMPVRFDEYDEHADDVDWRPTEGSNAATVLAFLIRHAGTGFTPGEIAEETGVPTGSVGPTLHRLRERGLVRHREPYWAAAGEDRIAAYEGMLQGMAALSDETDWSDVDAGEHTVDEEALAAWRDASDGSDG